MNRGIIQQAMPSKSGKSLRLQINNEWYSCDNWALQNAVGREIQFEIGTQSLPNGATLMWANKAELAGDAPPQAPQTMSQPAAQPAPSANNERDPTIYLPMVSNVVAHAIASGRIDKPESIAMWARMAHVAAKNVVEPPKDFDDDIPF